MKRNKLCKVVTVLFAAALISGAPAMVSSAQSYSVNALVNEDKEVSTVEAVGMHSISSMSLGAELSSSILSDEVRHGDSNIRTSGNQAVSASKNDSYLFPVPGNGWSTCYINISYMERYLTYNNFITFNQRERSYYADYAYAIERPSITLGNVLHYYPSGTLRRTFTSWSSFPVIFPGGHDEYSATMNSSSESYENHTGNYGVLPFQVACNGGYPSVYPDNLSLSLESN